jgi:hypothetical protein
MNAERRNWLAEAGRRQVQQFQWDRTAQQTLAIYEEVKSIKTIKSNK